MNAAALSVGDKGATMAKNFRAQQQALKDLRNGVEGGAAGFNEIMTASGRYNVETIKTISHTEALTKKIREQKLTWREMRQEMKKGGITQVANQQAALQASSAVRWGGSETGKQNYDVYMPKNLNGELTTARMHYGIINEAIKSAATQTINWGKNTQWAGRQITVGIGYPIALMAAAMGRATLEMDKQLTRIQKVYDVKPLPDGSTEVEQQMNREKELANVRVMALNQATYAAKNYGAAVEDTLSLQADLAAVGYSGLELQKSTNEVQRISTLGELDHQQALDMTITLMSTYHQKADQLGKTFNYINAVENATSLSTKDFAEALPRAGNALANLGVGVEQMGVLLVAMKEGGVDAAQGANALKSATARLLNPTKDATNQFRAMNVNIGGIVAESGGNLLEILKKIGEETKGYSQIQRQSAIAALFGTYQFNRLNVAVDNVAQGFAQTGNESSQTKAAIDAMNESLGGGANQAKIAAQELQQFQNSISGRFQIAIQSIRTEFAKMGAPVMQAATAIMNFAGMILSAFNNAPGWVKFLTMLGIGFLGIVGPVIMLIGLFANLWGNFLKVVAGVGSLITKTKILTAEEQAAKLASEAANDMMMQQTKNTEILRNSVVDLTESLKLLHAEQMKELPGQTASGIILPPSAMRTQDKKRMQQRLVESNVEPIDYKAADNAKKMEESLAKSEASTEGIKKNTSSFMTKLLGLSGAALMFHDMNLSGQSLLETILQMTILTGSLGMSGIGQGFKNLFSAGNAVSGMGKMARAGAAFKTVLGKVLSMGARLFTPAGLFVAGVGLAIGAFILLHKEITKFQRAQEEINKSTEYWSQTLGYTPNAQKPKEDQSILTQRAAEIEQTNKFRKANEALVKSLEDAASVGGSNGYQQLGRLATTEAIKVRVDGGSVEQAKEAFHQSLVASGIDSQTMEKLELTFASVDLSNPDAIAAEVKANVGSILDSVKNSEDGFVGNGFWDTVGKNLFNVDMNDAGRAAIANASHVAAEAMANAKDNWDANAVAYGFVDEFQKAFSDQFSFAMGNMDPAEKDALEAHGVNTADELYGAYTAALKKQSEGKELNAFEKSLLHGEGMSQFAETYGEGLDVALDKIGAAFGYSKDDVQAWIDKGWTMVDVMKFLKLGTMSVADAQEGFNKDVAMAGPKWATYTDAQKLATLNMWRLNAGLPPAKSLMEGFARSTGDAAEAARLLAGELTPLSEISLDNLTAGEYTGMLKDKYGGAMEVAYKAADYYFNRAQQREEDGLQASFDRKKKHLDDVTKATEKSFDDQGDALDDLISRENDAFDAETKAREDALDAQKKAAEDYYDGLKNAIDDQIAAIQKEDDIRQKLFEAEKNRLSRLAEMYNNNVDFNAALNSGNIDQAAKIYSSNMAQVQQNQLDDQAALLDGGSKGKIDDLNAQKDAIDKEKQAKLDAIDAEKDALSALRDHEKKLLDDRHDALKKDLENRKQIALDGLAAQKDALDKDLANKQQQTKEKWQAEQWSLDLELASIKASTPRNQAEYDAQVAQIEAAYKRHGVNLVGGDGKGGMVGGWHQAMADGMFYKTKEAEAKVRDNIAWAELGNAIQQEINKGTGISMQNMAHWLETGRWPVLKRIAGPDSGKAWYDPQDGSFVSKHSGGQIGTNPTWSQADRVGVPRSASLYPSEVPTILKQGEFVVNKTATDKNLELLHMINSHHSGGVVGAKGVRDKGFAHSGGLAGGAGLGMQIPLMAAAMSMRMIQAGMMNMLSGGMYTPGVLGGGDAGTGKFTTSNRNFPKAIRGVLSSNTKAAVDFVKKAFPKNAGIGTLGDRPNVSDHPMGKALDTMIPNYKSPEGIAMGNAISSWFIQNPNVFGTKYVIWRDRIAESDNKGWKPYTHPLGPNNNDTLQHRNHVHTSLYHGGGVVDGLMQNLPQLRTGGAIKHDNTLANLHKGETVLTNPLTGAMKDLIENGTNVQYNVAVDLRGALVRDDVDIERAIQRAIDKANAKDARKRVIK